MKKNGENKNGKWRMNCEKIMLNAYKVRRIMTIVKSAKRQTLNSHTHKH